MTPQPSRRIPTPLFYVSDIKINGTGCDFTILFSNVCFGQLESGELAKDGVVEPVLQLLLSPQSAKNLAILLAEQVSQHEAQWGEIRTPFTERIKVKFPKEKKDD